LVLLSIEMTERLRLGGSNFKDRGARPDEEGIERNLIDSLGGIEAFALLT
jgi:hypothetical protein